MDEHDEVGAIISKVADHLDKLGLYTTKASMGLVPLTEDIQKVQSGEMTAREAAEQGVAEITVMVMLDIGEVAWSDRILNPEAHKEMKEFQAIAPTEEEIGIETMKSELTDVWDGDWED